MKRLIALVAFFAAGMNGVQADSPILARTEASVITSQFGSNVFLVSLPPELKNGTLVSLGHTTAYRAEVDGSFRKLYELAHSIPDGAYVSHDARLIVTVAGMLPGHVPQKEHDCILLYRDGKLLQKYAVLDLVRSPAKVLKTASHYIWTADPYGKTGRSVAFTRTNTGYELQVRTIDGLEYTIDAENGRIIRRYDPANAVQR